MTVFEQLKSMNIDEFASWFEKNCTHDYDPAIKWWNERYCSKCEPLKVMASYLEHEIEVSWCEINDKCKFFQNMNKVPDNTQMIKMWLESEVEDNAKLL